MGYRELSDERLKSKQEIEFLVRIIICGPVVKMKNNKLINSLKDEQSFNVSSIPTILQQLLL